MGRIRRLPRRDIARHEAGPSWSYDSEPVDPGLMRPFTEHGVHPDYATVCLELGVTVAEMLSALATGLPGEYLALRRATQRAGIHDEHRASLSRVRHAPHILAGLIDGVPMRDLLAITDPSVAEWAADDYVRLRAKGATHDEAREVIEPQLIGPRGSVARTSLSAYIRARRDGHDHAAALAAHRGGYPKLST